MHIEILVKTINPSLLVVLHETYWFVRKMFRRSLFSATNTVMILSFRTDRSWQTVQTQIRLLLEDQSDRVYTVCNSVCIFWTHDSKVEPHCSIFRISTAVFWVSEFVWVLRCYLCSTRSHASENDPYHCYSNSTWAAFRIKRKHETSEHHYGLRLWKVRTVFSISLYLRQRGLL